MMMLRNIMEGNYTFESPKWADISGKSLDAIFIRFVDILFFFDVTIFFPPKK